MGHPENGLSRHANSADVATELSLCFITLVRSFAKAVFLGTIAGGAPMAMLTTMLAIIFLVGGEIGLLSFFWLSVCPFVIAFPMVLMASLVVGLPLTAFLSNRQWESDLVYIFIGVIVGFILPIVVLIMMEASAGYWIGLLGALSGGVTGRTWWIEEREPKVCYSE